MVKTQNIYKLVIKAEGSMLDEKITFFKKLSLMDHIKNSMKKCTKSRKKIEKEAKGNENKGKLRED